MIQLQHIEKSFGSKKVLNGIDLEFHRGELTFLIGTSGAGKTTLLNMLGGLDNPTSGKVLFQGSDISEDLPAYRGKKVGFIFQHYNLISGLSVR
ncbi:MAG: ATP-binding cassette domain-containing protein, partial [Oscillospiraceae bacterium]|nr:ATP-binding cassette domain-containing protein [Oscillospiraceae bacterium]